MTKTRTITAALAALTLATAFAATSGEAQAHPRWGWAIGAGVVTGAIVGAAVANSYAGPAYVYEPGYRCRFVTRYDAWGYPHAVKVCAID